MEAIKEESVEADKILHSLNELQKALHQTLTAEPTEM